MDNKADRQAPNANTLWLAIGIGAFSVFASFFMAIYFSETGSGGGTENDAGPLEAQRLEASAQSAD